MLVKSIDQCCPEVIVNDADAPANRGLACATEQRLGLLRSELDFAHVDSILAHGLHEFFDSLQTKMNTIDEHIRSDFFGQAAQAAAAA